MTDLTKLRAELRAGLDGVTPGPWQPSPQKGRPRHGDQAQVFRDHADSDLSILALDMTETEAEATATAAHIARCSPDNIRALLDALDMAERREKVWADLIAELTRERDEARRERDEARAKAIEEAEPVLRQALAVLARCFDRIHALPRSTDTALAAEIEETRAAIRALKDRAP